MIASATGEGSLLSVVQLGVFFGRIDSIIVLQMYQSVIVVCITIV